MNLPRFDAGYSRSTRLMFSLSCQCGTSSTRWAQTPVTPRLAQTSQHRVISSVWMILSRISAVKWFAILVAAVEMFSQHALRIFSSGSTTW